jgi:hypothetical protein
MHLNQIRSELLVYYFHCSVLICNILANIYLTFVCAIIQIFRTAEKLVRGAP